MRLSVSLAVAALCGLSFLRPQPSCAQEVTTDIPPPEVAWEEPHRGDLANVLKAYYTVLIHSDMTKSCRAERGEVCMNGDHEDQLWLSSTPREPERIGRFVRRIAEVARSRPDDALGFAQAVYAVARLRPPAEALALAEDCTLVHWWCDLVMGMAQQRAGRYERAGRHFRAALPAADAALVCRLTGIGELLDGSDRRDYRRLSCSDRTDFERRFWWLTDPMISMPGNDRWTEHMSRHAVSRIQRRARNPHGLPWTSGLDELAIRYGQETSWTRYVPTSGSSMRPRVTGRHPPHSERYMPPDGVLTGVASLPPGMVWGDPVERPRSAYAPSLSFSR